MPKLSEQPTARRPRRPSISNEQLLAKAFELFVELGFEGTSIDAITAEAGIAKRTIYSRYGDKESLFKAALEQEIEQFTSAFRNLPELECDNLEATLVRIGNRLLERVLSPEGIRLLQLTGAIAPRLPEIGARNVEQGTEPILSYLDDLFHRRLGTRLQCASSEAALLFMNLVVGGPGNVAAQGLPLEDQFRDRYVTLSVGLFLRGVQSAPASHRSECALEEENHRLKKLLAEAMIELDIAQQEARGRR